MNMLILMAILGQNPHSLVGDPIIPRHAEMVSEPFPERPIPRVFRVVTQREVPEGETYRVALADEPPKAHDVARPAPAKGVDDYSARDNDRDNRIFQLEQEVKNLTRRLAELERGRAVTGAPRTAATVCPMGCPNCEMACKFPGECGHPECGGMRARTAPAPIAKQWFDLTNEPGTQGYGAQNPDGQVVVEQRRPKALPVATYTQPTVNYASPYPATYATPYAGVYGTPYYGATYGSGFGAGGACSLLGGCSPVGAVRGLFGRILGR
jgi:hypothetical protein